MHYLRSASLRGFRSVVADLGGDAEALARRAGLDPECLDHDDQLVPLVPAATLLEIAADELVCPDLGLRIAQRQSVSVLGALAVAMTNSPTIGNALEVLSRYLTVHSGGLELSLGDDPRGDRDTTALYYGPATVNGPVQAVDLGLGFIHRVIAYLNKRPYGLRGVELPYVPAAPVQAHRDFFDAPVNVGQSMPAAILRLPASLPSRRLDGVNETIRQLAVAFLAEQSSSTEHDIVSQVRIAVRESLGTGSVELAGISRLVFVHPRTLQRQLAAADLTFAEIVDDARREAALRLLKSTELSLGQISAMVGFVEQPSFTRAARRWWGVPPSTMRRRPS